MVGGGAYQVPLIKRFVELGFYTCCIDKNPYSLGFQYATESSVIDIIDKDSCLSYARKKGIQAVMTYGATLPLPTVAFIAKELNLPSIPIETAIISKNKFEIKKRLMESGCNILGDFFRLDSVNEIIKHNFALPCVMKPCDGSGSKGVSIVYKRDEIESAVKYALDSARYGEIYCEKFIYGEEYSVEAFVNNGAVYVYGIIKTTFVKHGDDNESIEYGHRTPSGLSNSVEKSIENEVEKAIKGLNVTMGSVNFDVIVSNDNTPYIIDCGIRIGQNLIASHIIPLSRGVNILDSSIYQALGEEVDAYPKKKGCIATRLLIYNPGIIKEIKNTSDLIGKSGVIDVVLRKKVGDIQNVYTDKSDTCGWVICGGETPEEAEENASNARKKLKSYFVIK